MEVMVAVAILGLALTMILAAQAGALASAAHTRNLSVATGLVRCKMTEIEDHLQRDGFQELDESDNGVCCEGDETPNMSCSWRIEKPEFPEPKYGELNLDTDIGSSALDPLSALAGSQGSSPEGSITDLAQTLAGGSGAEGAAGMLSGLLGTFMGMVYPDLKSIFEASTRRITVKVTWTEGVREHEIELVQWYTIPQKGPPPSLSGEGGAGGGG
jgi:general secretion pathway protein I